MVEGTFQRKGIICRKADMRSPRKAGRTLICAAREIPEGTAGCGPAGVCPAKFPALSPRAGRRNGTGDANLKTRIPAQPNCRYREEEVEAESGRGAAV